MIGLRAEGAMTVLAATGRGAVLVRARLHRSGTKPLKVLLVGDRGLLLEQRGGASLAQRALDRIWLGARHGVDLDVLADLDPVLERVTGDFAAWRTWRFDAVVLAVGDGLSDRRRVRALHRVLALLQADGDRGTPVVLLTSGWTGHRGPVDEELRLLRRIEAAAPVALRAAEVPVRAEPVEQARAWAAVIGTEVVAALATGPGRGDAEPQGEVERQRALDELGVVGRPPDPRLDDLVRLACTAFGAESAEINFIDRDRQWKMAVAGAERGENPRAHSFCSQTILRPEPLVVGDARLDPVLRSSPLVSGPNPIRFYAAHPIESADGYRIGSFCVYDREPRDVRGLDLAVLRDLALLAQAELIAHDTAPDGAAERLEAPG